MPTSAASGATPTMVHGRSSMVRTCPSAAGSRWNCLIHSRSLMITLGTPVLYSASVNVRPAIGWTPTRGSRPEVTSSIAIRIGSPEGLPSVASSAANPPSPSRLRDRARRSTKSGIDAGSRVVPLSRSVSHIANSRSASGYGSGFSSTACTTATIDDSAPMPMASVRTLVARNPGLLRSTRTAYDTSRAVPASQDDPCSAGGAGSGRRLVVRSARSLVRTAASSSSARIAAAAS